MSTKKKRCKSLQIPEYRLHRHSGRAVVTFRNKETGKREDHYLGVYDSPESRAEYKRLIAESLSTGRTPHAPESATQGFTITELIARYCNHLEHRHRDEMHKVDRVRLPLSSLA